MSKMTPEQEARYALGFNVARSGLSMAAQLEYDRLLREGYGGHSKQKSPMPSFRRWGCRSAGIVSRAMCRRESNPHDQLGRLRVRRR